MNWWLGGVVWCVGSIRPLPESIFLPRSGLFGGGARESSVPLALGSSDTARKQQLLELI